MHLSVLPCKTLHQLKPNNADLAASILFGVTYWFIWTVALPRYRGYRLEEEGDILGEGTTITKLIRKEL